MSKRSKKPRRHPAKEQRVALRIEAAEKAALRGLFGDDKYTRDNSPRTNGYFHVAYFETSAEELERAFGRPSLGVSIAGECIGEEAYAFRHSDGQGFVLYHRFGIWRVGSDDESGVVEFVSWVKKKIRESEK